DITNGMDHENRTALLLGLCDACLGWHKVMKLMASTWMSDSLADYFTFLMVVIAHCLVAFRELAQHSSRRALGCGAGETTSAATDTQRPWQAIRDSSSSLCHRTSSLCIRMSLLCCRISSLCPTISLLSSSRCRRRRCFVLCTTTTAFKTVGGS